MDSDSGIAFDQKLSAALKIFGTRSFGEIAFQLDRKIMETMFQPGTSASNDDLIKKIESMVISLPELRRPDLKGNFAS